MVQGGLPGQRLHPAHAGRHAALGDQLEQADIAGAANVGAAAQLDRVAHLHHPHPVAVFLAEQGDGANVHGLLHAHFADHHLVVGAHLAVHLALDRRQLAGIHRLEVGKVEAQAVGRHQRALLRHVGAKQASQRPVQQVGRAVVEHGTGPALGVDGGEQAVADLQAAAAHAPEVAVELAGELAGVVDVEARALGEQLTGIANLAA